jgi:VanZ family protein
MRQPAGVDPLFRFRRAWEGIGAVLVAVVVFLSLVPSHIEVLGAQGDKYEHVLAYATLMLWHAQLYTRRESRVRLAVAFVTLGIVLEFVQRLSGWRTFDLGDAAAGVLGVAIGGLAAPPRLPNFLLMLEAAISRPS